MCRMDSFIRIKIANGEKEPVNVSANDDTTVAELKATLFRMFNVPYSHQKILFNKRRLDKKENVDVPLKKFNLVYGKGKFSSKASCIVFETFFPLKEYHKGGKAYAYVGRDGVLKTSPVNSETFMDKYLVAAQSSFSVRIIMYMWSKNYLTRLILVTSFMFLFFSLFIGDPAEEMFHSGM